VGNDVEILAGSEGDLIFTLASENDAEYADLILISMDSLPLWNAALTTLPINVTKSWYQIEGQHESTSLMAGPPVNLMAMFGGTGAVGARMLDKALKLEPGTDVGISLINADLANPHTLYGGLVVHRF
jgi:hypothetical protein